MRTTVFAYRGMIGIKSDYETEGLLNNPADAGQLGFVMNADKVDFSEDAITALKTVKKSSDDIGDVDLFVAADDVRVFSWMGGPLWVIDPKKAEGSSTYDPSFLKAAKEDIEIPQDFKDMTDDYLDKEPEED